MDDREIAARQFREAGEDAAVVRDESEQGLDLVALLVELPVGRALLDAGSFGRDHRQGAAGRDGLKDRVGGVGLVGDPCLGREAVEQGQGLRRVARLPGGQAEGQRVAEGVAGSVQLAGEAAARVRARAFSAPAAPAWARTTVRSSITHSRSPSAAN